MRPILFQWRGLTVWSYPAMLYLGLSAGVASGNIAAHATGIDAFRFFVATLVLIGPALIGARLMYVASIWPVDRRSLGRMWNRNEGGAAQDGGIAAALLLSVPVFAVLGLPLGASWDAAAFTMLPIPAFARVGCVLNGCCAGRRSTGWIGVTLPNHRGVWERRIPSQGLEAAWAVVLLLVGLAVWSRLPFQGALFLLMTALYTSGRIVLLATRELLSDEHSPAIQRSLSAFMILASVAALVARWPA